MIITNVDILKCFAIKRAFRQSWSSLTFLRTFCCETANYEHFKFNVFLDLYAIDLNNQGQNTTAFSHETTQETSEEKHFNLPAKFKLAGMTSCLAA